MSTTFDISYGMPSVWKEAFLTRDWIAFGTDEGTVRSVQSREILTLFIFGLDSERSRPNPSTSLLTMKDDCESSQVIIGTVQEPVMVFCSLHPFMRDTLANPIGKEVLRSFVLHFKRSNVALRKTGR